MSPSTFPNSTTNSTSLADRRRCCVDGKIVDHEPTEAISSVTSAPTLRLNERHSLGASLNEMDVVDREIEPEDGSRGEADQ